ncbi:hypothetical protein WG922_14855 [Ramlibacter sp. AN1015]|uniref:hypothetical protein n=1 Tax=Ramlibacter sp. AN1015 TaxID=3133428 RepID=UPI0030BB43F5
MPRSVAGSSRLAPALRKALGLLAAAAALAGVFALYTEPTILVSVSEMVWACFN